MVGACGGVFSTRGRRNRSFARARAPFPAIARARKKAIEPQVTRVGDESPPWAMLASTICRPDNTWPSSNATAFAGSPLEIKRHTPRQKSAAGRVRGPARARRARIGAAPGG